MDYLNLLVRMSLAVVLWLGSPGADTRDILTSFRFTVAALAAARAAGPAMPLPDFASIVEANKRSVVNITAIVPQDTSEASRPGLRRPSSNSSAVSRFRAAGAAPVAGIGIHRQRGQHHTHQRACRGGRM
jgi:hypothetical protein